MHWLTRRAPFRSATLADPPLQVDFSTVTTAKDVVTILSTEPLTTDEHWQPLQPGECLLFCAGELLQRSRHDRRPAPMATAGSVSLKEASCFWLRLGLVSFGGPAGQIALLHRELVDRRHWLSGQRYMHALNYCMLLPGPEATQLATYLGWLMHGVPGGLIAGGLFLAPSCWRACSRCSSRRFWRSCWWQPGGWASGLCARPC